MRVSAVDGNLSASVQIDMCEIGFVLDGKPSPYQGQFEVPDCVIVGSEVAGVNQLLDHVEFVGLARKRTWLF